LVKENKRLFDIKMYDFEGDDFFSLKQRSQVLRYALSSSDGYGTLYR
jgi:hypothetical protein